MTKVITGKWDGEMITRTETAEERLLRMIPPLKVARIDTYKNGSEIVTLEDEHGQLTHEPKKNVSKELLAEYKGEVYNRYKE